GERTSEGKPFDCSFGRVGGGTHSHRQRTSSGAPLGGGSGDGSEWQLEREGRTLADLRLHPDLSVHALDQPFADVQAEAGATDALPHVWIETMELLEDPMLILERE